MEQFNVYVLTVADKEGIFFAGSYSTKEEAKEDAAHWFGNKGLCDWHKSTASTISAAILDIEGCATITPTTFSA